MCVAPFAASAGPRLPGREQDKLRDDVAVVAIGFKRRFGGCVIPMPGGGSGVKLNRGEVEWERLRESWCEDETERSEDESLIPEPKYGE
jgi:hypothetical protein